MKKTIRALLLVVIVAGTFACCLLRLFQLLRYTDAQTGLVFANPGLTKIIYAVLAGLAVFCGVYAYIEKGVHHIELAGNRSVCAGTVALAVLYFADFLHQCYNCYLYVDTTSIIEYNYFLPLVLSALVAVICSFYMLSVISTARGNGIDFRKFTLLHFAVPVWAFVKLVMLMLRIVDVAQGVESVIEFFVLVSILSFSLSSASTIEKGEGNVSRLFIFSGLMLFCFNTVISFPRLVVLLSGRGEMLFNAGFTSTVYFALGVTAFLIVIKSSATDTVSKDKF